MAPFDIERGAEMGIAGLVLFILLLPVLFLRWAWARLTSVED